MEVEADMAKMYQYYEFEDFPRISTDEPLITDAQLPLVPDRPWLAHTTIVHQGKSDHPDFERYFVEHEAERANFIWRGETGDKRRGGLVEIIEFHMYRHKDGHFFIDANHDNILEMCKRIRSACGKLEVRRKETDLLRSKEELHTRVSGGYFGSLTIERVQAASIFGPDVGESNMWTDLEEHGELNAMTIDVKYLGEVRTVMIHRLGGVMPYKVFGENDALDIVQEVRYLLESLSRLTSVELRRRRER